MDCWSQERRGVACSSRSRKLGGSHHPLRRSTRILKPLSTVTVEMDENGIYDVDDIE